MVLLLFGVSCCNMVYFVGVVGVVIDFMCCCLVCWCCAVVELKLTLFVVRVGCGWHV